MTPRKNKYLLFSTIFFLAIIVAISCSYLYFGYYSTGNFNGDAILINGKKIIVDKQRHIALYPCSPLDFEAEHLSLRISAAHTSDIITVDGINTSDTTILLSPPYKNVRIPLGSTVSQWGINRNDQVMLSLTCLPIIELNFSDLGDEDYASGGKMQIHIGQDSIFQSNTSIRHRGDSSKAHKLAKRSYGIKLTDDQGEKNNKKLLNLRKSDSWILDPMVADRLRMHNIANFDLWNEFSSAPYHTRFEKKVKNGVSGQYVELFCNGEYQGLYCLLEKINHNLLKLAKTDEDGTIHGILYKDKSLVPSDTTAHHTRLRNIALFIGDRPLPMKDSDWVIKYPKNNQADSVYQPLEDVIHFLNESSPEEFAQQADDWLDIPVWTDFYLFARLTLAIDNVKNNKFVYFYDIKQSHKLGIAPWDTDSTWDNDVFFGRHLKQSQINVYEDRLKTHKIFERLQKDYPNYAQILATRWQELRSSYLSYENITAHFQKYYDLMEYSGARVREEQRWTMPTTIQSREISIPFMSSTRKSSKWSLEYGEKIDIISEFDYFKQLLKTQLEILDEQLYNLYKPSENQY